MSRTLLHEQCLTTILAPLLVFLPRVLPSLVLQAVSKGLVRGCMHHKPNLLLLCPSQCPTLLLRYCRGRATV